MDHVHTKASAWAANVPRFGGAATDYLVDPRILGERGFYLPPAHPTSGQKRFLRCYQIEGTVYPGRNIAIAACGEMLPRRENCLTIHPTRKDRWGLPVAHIDIRWSENERRMMEHQKQTILDLLSRLGASQWSISDPIPGDAVHEAGGARMGSSPSDSVVNSYGQLWDVPNVFVCDAAVLPSIGFQNTTLTMMALGVRCCGYVLDAGRAGEI
jgi:choline dehydrogenase-like flavoprotein